MTYVKSIILIIVLLFLITFGVKNNQPASLNYYFNITTGAIPLYGIVYISIIIGVVIGMIVGIFSRFTLQGKVRTLQSEVKELKERAVEEKEEREEERKEEEEEKG